MLAQVEAAEVAKRTAALDAARAWLAKNPRMNADNVEGFKVIVAGLAGYQHAPTDTSWNARADTLRAWLADQARTTAA